MFSAMLKKVDTWRWVIAVRCLITFWLHLFGWNLTIIVNIFYCSGSPVFRFSKRHACLHVNSVSAKVIIQTNWMAIKVYGSAQRRDENSWRLWRLRGILKSNGLKYERQKQWACWLAVKWGTTRYSASRMFISYLLTRLHCTQGCKPFSLFINHVLIQKLGFSQTYTDECGWYPQ